MNRTIVFAALLGLLSAALLQLSCDHSDPIGPTAAPGNDTLYTKYVVTSTDLFRLTYHMVKSEAQGDSLLERESAPAGAEPITFSDCSDLYDRVRPTRPLLTELHFDTTIRFVDNPASTDTVRVFDTIYVDIEAEHDTLIYDLDSLEQLRRTTPPAIHSKSAVQSELDSLTEGYRQYVKIQATHLEDDSTTFTLLNTPPWIRLFEDNKCDDNQVFFGNGNAHFYTRCNGGVKTHIYLMSPYELDRSTPRFYDYSTPYIGVKPDSTAVGSTYTWDLVIANKYGRSDTLHMVSRVLAAPDTACE